MKQKKLPAFLLFCFLIGFLGSCTRYVISPQLREQALSAPGFPAVLERPDDFIGVTVIWGGYIIETVNEPLYTKIKILETPLDFRQAPVVPEEARGRFIAQVSGYLDREVYQKGKRVTVAGQVIGKEVLPLSHTQYTYPVVSVKEIYLWQDLTADRPYVWYGCGYPSCRPYVPYWWGWGFYSY